MVHDPLSKPKSFRSVFEDDESTKARNYEDYTYEGDVADPYKDMSPTSTPDRSASSSCASLTLTLSEALESAEAEGRTLFALCDLIAAHLFLQRTKILSTESYAREGYLYNHRFIVLELRTSDGQEGYLRLERRRNRQSGIPSLIMKGGKGPVNDVVRFSYIRSFRGSLI